MLFQPWLIPMAACVWILTFSTEMLLPYVSINTIILIWLRIVLVLNVWLLPMIKLIFFKYSGNKKTLKKNLSNTNDVGLVSSSVVLMLWLIGTYSSVRAKEFVKPFSLSVCERWIARDRLKIGYSNFSSVTVNSKLFSSKLVLLGLTN